MELDFTADQDELRDSIRTVLQNESPIGVARAVVETGAPADALWTTVAELGWPALTVPEEFGGIGLGAVEAGILSEELGRAIAPGPLLATVTQYVPVVRALGDTAQQARFLGAVAAGECRATLALAEPNGSCDPAATTVVARRVGNGYELSGTKRYVVEGDQVDEIAVVVRELDADECFAVVVPRRSLKTQRVDSFDASRALVHVDFDGVSVDEDRALRSGGTTELRAAIEEATVAIALEIVGAAQSIFDMTLEYAKQREQFGVPIGSFQAIKHKFADMLVAVERARATGYFAALTIAEDDARRTMATSVAKAAAGDCQRLLGKEGIQIHGGIGYTWEHDVHLYVKRMKSGEPMFGTSSWHRARIADLLGV